MQAVFEIGAMEAVVALTWTGRIQGGRYPDIGVSLTPVCISIPGWDPTPISGHVAKLYEYLGGHSLRHQST